MRRHALIHRLVHVGVEALSMRELRGFSDFCGVLRGLGIAARVCIGSGGSQGQPGNGRESSCGVARRQELHTTGLVRNSRSQSVRGHSPREFLIGGKGGGRRRVVKPAGASCRRGFSPDSPRRKARGPSTPPFGGGPSTISISICNYTAYM